MYKLKEQYNRICVEGSKMFVKGTTYKEKDLKGISKAKIKEYFDEIKVETKGE